MFGCLIEDLCEPSCAVYLKCILNICFVFMKGILLKVYSSIPTLSELGSNVQMENKVPTGNTDQGEAQGMNLFGHAETHCNNFDRSESIRMITRSQTFSSLTQGAALWLQLSDTNWPFFWCLENVAGWLGPVNVDGLAERRVSDLTYEQINTYLSYNNMGKSKIQVIARIKKLK